jgi:hypothetical protein
MLVLHGNLLSVASDVALSLSACGGSCEGGFIQEAM